MGYPQGRKPNRSFWLALALLGLVVGCSGDSNPDDSAAISAADAPLLQTEQVATSEGKPSASTTDGTNREQQKPPQLEKLPQLSDSVAEPGQATVAKQTDPQANSRTVDDLKTEASRDAGLADATQDRDQRDPAPTRLAIDDEQEEPDPLEHPIVEIPDHWAHLFPNKEVWADTKNKKVIVGGKVCLTMGPLEMFICPDGTKQHESIVAANALASEVHAALLVIGATPGQTALFEKEGYTPAYGPKIEIEMMWRDQESGELKTRSSRDWIRNVTTKKRMEANFVFGGSRISVDPDTNEKFYLGNLGELICLSNFSTATIDINVESSDQDNSLLFEAFTENIPPIGTHVYAVITAGPVIGKVKDQNPQPAGLAGSAKSNAPPEKSSATAAASDANSSAQDDAAKDDAAKDDIEKIKPPAGSSASPNAGKWSEQNDAREDRQYALSTKPNSGVEKDHPPTPRIKAK